MLLQMRLTIAYSKMKKKKKRKLVLIINVTHQREAFKEWSIQLPLGTVHYFYRRGVGR